MWHKNPKPKKKQKLINTIKPKVTEADLSIYAQRKIQFLGLFGGRISLGGVIRNRGGKMFLTPNTALKGFPDFAGIFDDGVLWTLELKTVKGQLRPEQKHWEKGLTARGCLHAVARTYEQIDEFLTKVVQRNKESVLK